MRFLVVFLSTMTALVIADMGQGGMVKKWAEYKAMESCYGEDVTKGHMLKMKKAVSKCTKTDMPELELPMFR
jgi:hypothetical protein